MIKKRFLSIFMAMLICVTVFPVTQITASSADDVPLGKTEIVLPAIAGQEDNILINGDFESVTGNACNEWGAVGGKWGEMAVVMNDGNSPDGGKYVMIDSSKGTANPFIVQYFNTYSRAVYQFECWVKKDIGDNRGVIKLEFLPDSNIPGASGTVAEYNPVYITDTGGEWQKILFNFRAPLTAARARILVRISGNTEKVCYDDLSLRMVQGPPKGNVSTDAVFYYPDEKEGKATLTAITSFYPDAADGTVDFALYDGDAILAQTKGVAYQGNTATYKFDLALLKEQKKEYMIKAVMKDNNGNEFFNCSQPVYKYPRPLYLDKNGINYDENGNIFTPVIGYTIGVVTKENLEKCKAAGITVVQTSAQYLDTIRDSGTGIKAMVTLYPGMEPAGHKSNETATIRTVTNYKDHPSVWGWAIMDEPFLNCGDPEDDLRNSYKIIRDIDDKHPVYLCENQKSFYPVSAKYVDILGIDPYPTKGMDTSLVYKCTEDAVKNAHGKPVLTVNMAYRDTTSYYLPTGANEHHLIYQSLFGGATAIGYYQLIAPVKIDNVSYPLWNITQVLPGSDLWDGINAFAKKEQELALGHFYEKKYPGFSKYRGNEYSYELFVKDNDLYAMIINNSLTNDTVVSIPLESYNGIKINNAAVEVISRVDSGNPVVENGNLNLTLKPAEAAMCKLTAQDVNFSTITAEGFEEYYSKDNENPEESANKAVITNGDFEQGLNSFTATGENCSVTETITYANSAKALEITDTGSVTQGIELLPKTQYYVTAYFKLNSYEGTGGGAKLTVLAGDDSTIYETSFFTELNENWRKMMIIIPKENTHTGVKIKLSMTGEGKVYFDNVSLEKTDDIILNGDFEGLASDTTFAGFDDMWVNSGSATITNKIGTDNSVSVSNQANNGIKSKFSLEKDKIYKLSFRYYAEDAYSPWMQIRYTYMNGAAANPIYNNQGQLAHRADMKNNWYDFEYYFTCHTASPAAYIILGSRNGKEVIYDDIKLEKIGDNGNEYENIEFYKNGQQVTDGFEAGDEVTVKYSSFATDYTQETGKAVTFFVCLYKMLNGTPCLDEIQIENGAAKKSYVVNFASGVTYQGSPRNGEAPLEFEKTVTVPNDGNAYEIRAFAWDGSGALKPYIMETIR